MTEDLSIYNKEGSELRRLQLRMLSILKTVTSIADKHNIPYWISGGTLLGAIRHQGFIPWDDDIDIELLKPDYDKLIKILGKELPDDLYLQTPSEKGYRLLFSKVRDKNSRIEEHEDELDVFAQKGIYIDIFPEELSYRKLKNVVDFFYGRAYRRIKRGRQFKSIKYFCEYTISLFLYPIGYVLMWIARGICHITKPTNMLHSYGIGNSSNHDVSYVLPTSRVIFENYSFSAPGNPHLYLKNQYGNYMSIPPKDKRQTHIVKVEYK